MPLDMEFFHKAIKVLETLVKALEEPKNSYPCPVNRYRAIPVRYPEFTKHMVRVKKHVRPPVRAGPDIRRYIRPL